MISKLISMLIILRILEYLLSCNFNCVFVQLGTHDPLQRDRGTKYPHLTSSHTTPHTTGTILVIHN